MDGRGIGTVGALGRAGESVFNILAQSKRAKEDRRLREQLLSERESQKETGRQRQEELTRFIYGDSGLDPGSQRIADFMLQSGGEGDALNFLGAQQKTLSERRLRESLPDLNTASLTVLPEGQETTLQTRQGPLTIKGAPYRDTKEPRFTTREEYGGFVTFDEAGKPVRRIPKREAPREPKEPKRTTDTFLGPGGIELSAKFDESNQEIPGTRRRTGRKYVEGLGFIPDEGVGQSAPAASGLSSAASRFLSKR